jgi:hypothetical protein
VCGERKRRCKNNKEKDMVNNLWYPKSQKREKKKLSFALLTSPVQLKNKGQRERKNKQTRSPGPGLALEGVLFPMLFVYVCLWFCLAYLRDPIC